MLGGENIHPHPGIGDGFFDFKLISAKQFNFIDVFTAEIVCDTDEYTFWKVERYSNDTLEKTFYFYTNRVINYLKNAFTLELVLDVYLTYTKDIVKKLDRYDNVKIKRGTIAPYHLKSTTRDRDHLWKALSNVENNVTGGDDGYEDSIAFPIINYDDNSNLFPLASNGTSLLGQTISLLSPKTQFYNTGGTNSIWNFDIYDIKNQKKIMSDMKIESRPTYSGYVEMIIPTTADDGIKLQQVNNRLLEAYKINKIYKNKNNITWEEFNNNVMNGYFAVFKHRDGYIDAYPIIGNFEANITVPIVRADRTIGNVAPARIYLDGFNEDFNLYNSWGEIYDRFIVKKQEYYGDGFLGIYKWCFLAGAKSKLHFYLWEKPLPAGNYIAETGNGSVSYQGNTYTGKHNFPFMMFYRFNYSDVIGMLIGNCKIDNGKIIKEPFYLTRDITTENSIIENYVDLLQPILIQNNQIIPAKYCFLGFQALGEPSTFFNIPITFGFTTGFKLFCNTTLYNSATLGISLGGTLPATTGKYFDQLAAIEQQKNAGIASSVANLFARPLNWLSGGLSGAKTDQFSNLASDTTAFNVSNVVGEAPGLPTRSNTQNSGWNTTLTGIANRNLQANIGGVGGFIGDFVNIANSIKQSNVAKRNIGIGYLSSTDDDMYNAIVNNGFVSKLGENHYPLDKGIFTYGFKLLFDWNTKKKYIYYYDNFGFPIDSCVSGKYFDILLSYKGPTTYFELDKNWCLTNLTELSNYNDNLIRNAIINQLVGGVRFRRYD